ncbi:MAG: aldose epimerase family protein [Gaiellales bacterium]
MELIPQARFGLLPDGTPVTRFRLTAADGLSVGVVPFGASVTDVSLPADEGFVQVALGLPDAAAYAVGNRPYLGSTIGRFAGRIGGAAFTLDGERFTLPANDGPNCLHGGVPGFARRLWAVVAGDRARLELRHVSPDGEEGFPGKLVADLAISVAPGELRLDFTATCDRATVVNLTNHTYWNLAGEGSGSVGEHLLTVAADRVLACDEANLPTGEVLPLTGSALDLRAPTRLRERFESGEPAIARAGGLDHTFVLADAPRAEPVLAAVLVDPASERRLEVRTTEPALQVYTGNDLDGTLVGVGGRPYGRHAGIALEPQRLPDSPSHASFPSTVLRPGETYRSTTIFAFG